MSLLLSNLTKEYELRGSAPHPAVTDVSLEIESGKFYTLLGPSGCGKTTLLRLIAGFEHPTRGEIVHNGRALEGVPPYRRGFPMVFQSYALFPHMTVLENVGYGLKFRTLSRAGRAQRVERALALLELEAQRARYPSQLSGGQQQRVALARALVLEPEIILLDEPLSSLDAGLRVAMRGEIRTLQKRLGITAVYVTHDQEEALAISDTIVILNRGRIEQIGSPVDVYQRPATEFVARFMGCPNILPVEAVPPDGLRVLGENYAWSAAAGQRHAVLRPDAVEIAPDRGRHHGTVEEATFLGSHLQYRLRLADGTRLVIDQPVLGDMPVLETGDAVRFNVLPQRLHFL